MPSESKARIDWFFRGGGAVEGLDGVQVDRHHPYMTMPAKKRSVEVPFVESPDISGITIEDDEPVDSLYAEKQQRLLTESLYASWNGPPTEDGQTRTFMATANVGLFISPSVPPLVPDVMVSADVQVHPEFNGPKKYRSYFIWEMGKAPEVVIEVVSNSKGGELGKRKRGYARMGVSNYVVWDPRQELGEVKLQTFERRGDLLVPVATSKFEVLGLRLIDWEGTYEGATATWLRWSRNGVLIPTGAERAATQEERADRQEERADRQEERADKQEERADKQEERADKQEARAEQQRRLADEQKGRADERTAELAAEKARADRLAALLREHGIEAS